MSYYIKRKYDNKLMTKAMPKAKAKKAAHFFAGFDEFEGEVFKIVYTPTGTNRLTVAVITPDKVVTPTGHNWEIV